MRIRLSNSLAKRFTSCGKNISQEQENNPYGCREKEIAIVHKPQRRKGCDAI